MQLDRSQRCVCEEPAAPLTLFESRYVGCDDTNGRFADVTVERCTACGHLWLQYRVEHEAFGRSARWARGRITPEDAAGVTAEMAAQHIDTLDWYIRGGSYFGVASRGDRPNAVGTLMDGTQPLRSNTNAPQQATMTAAEALMWIATGSTACLEFATQYPGSTVTWIETRDPSAGDLHVKSIDDAIQDLERALIEGRLKCHGRIGGSTIEIDHIQWAHLIILYGQNAARRRDDGIIEELVFLTPGVLALWPPEQNAGDAATVSHDEDEIVPEQTSIYPADPPEGLSGGYPAEDWPILKEMRLMILRLQAKSPHDAAHKVKMRAAGRINSQPDSWAKRLERGYGDIDWTRWERHPS